LKQFAAIDRTGSGKTRDHAALLIRIGDLTIVDWSHNGKYNIWRQRDRGAPKLFEKEYIASTLASPWRSTSHIGPERDYWQTQLAQIIYDETGRRVSPAQWRPRRAG
jgi:hypothetical protein